MSDFSFAQDPVQARMAAAAARQAAAEAASPVIVSNEKGPANPVDSPVLTVPVVPPVVTTTGGAGATGGSVVLPRTGAAADELRAVLRRYGLDGLFNDLNAAVIADSTLVKNADALFGAVRQNPIYQQRFKGNAERVKKGLAELS